MSGKVPAPGNLTPAVVTPPKGTEVPGSPSTFQRAKDGIGAGTSYMASAGVWTAKTVRNSTPWYYLTWPFSTVGSLLSGIWARISKVFLGSPTPVSKEVKNVSINFPGYFGSTVKKTTPEEALRKGWMTLEEVIKQQETGFDMEQAKIQGWLPVEIPGRFWGSNKMLLKDAIEGGFMTVKEAIKAGHIDGDQVAPSWLKLVTPEKK